MPAARYVLWEMECEKNQLIFSVHPEGVFPDAFANDGLVNGDFPDDAFSRDVAVKASGGSLRSPKDRAEYVSRVALSPPLPLVYCDVLSRILAVRHTLMAGADKSSTHHLIRGRSSFLPGVRKRLRNFFGTSDREASREVNERLRQWFGNEVPHVTDRRSSYATYAAVERSTESSDWFASGEDGIGLFPEVRGDDRDRPSLVATGEHIAHHALDLLKGRALFTREIARGLTERGLGMTAGLDRLLDAYVGTGKVIRVPGVGLAGNMIHRGVLTRPGTELSRWKWRCNRCFSETVRLVPCAFCRWQRCPRCLTCDNLGISTGCTALYYEREDEREVGRARGLSGLRGPQDLDGSDSMAGASTGLTPPGQAGRVPKLIDVRVDLPFQLSPHQRAVSDELLQTDRDALIWAACGAGKTETVLEVMKEAVSDGHQVLFAVPRRDVAIQLGERLSESLAGATVVTLTGETPERYADAPVIVSTVHQAVRFYRAFHLIIVDEVDAFPLNRETWLLTALERAKSPKGRVVMMTATPPERLLHLIKTQELAKLTLPGRPHGHPLPVPEIICDPKADNDRPEVRSRLVAGFIENSVNHGRKLIVFVPTIALAESLLQSLSREMSSFRVENRALRIEFVHAKDVDRRAKVSAFLDGKIDVIVSTTILERGITAPYLDVLVFLADTERLFDAASLIQMAGRAGRSFEDPSGRVVFLASRPTPAMTDAVATIQQLNDLNARSMPEMH